MPSESAHPPPLVPDSAPSAASSPLPWQSGSRRKSNKNPPPRPQSEGSRGTPAIAPLGAAWLRGQSAKSPALLSGRSYFRDLAIICGKDDQPPSSLQVLTAFSWRDAPLAASLKTLGVKNLF